MSAVRAAGVTKRFDDVRALESVDLEVQPGEICGLLGPNGAGKTTLLRILFGLLAPDAGSVELLGRAPEHDGWALQGVAGFVETPAFYPYLSGRANLELLAQLDGGGGGGRIDEALARVGLLGRAEDRVNGYSTGMRQRLGIAAALIRAPRLLLLDEPTAGLDPPGVRDVFELMGELAAEGVATLVSSHQIAGLEGVCDRFAFLRQGRVAWRGSAARLRAQAPASGYVLLTSDDGRALEIGRHHDGIELDRAGTGGLTLRAEPASLDPFVLALARAGIAVRQLELRVSPVEAMFFQLTGEPPGDHAETRDYEPAAAVGA